MSNYLYLFRGGAMANLSPEAMQQSMKKWGAWIQELTKTGNFKAGEPLETSGKVLAGKKKTLTDGPYAEAKDVVGGYLVVTAPSLDAATELARGCPIFENDGTVEVRAIAEMPR